MRGADRAAIRGGVSAARLMENAAFGLVAALAEAYPGWKRVVVACGPGNNGGDGLAASRMLAQRGLSISLFTLRDPLAYRKEAAQNASAARHVGLELHTLSGRLGEARFRRAMADADGVLDALFGTGLSRPLSGGALRAVNAIVRSERTVVAADVPSGLSSDSGEILGSCVQAQLTVAFAAAKHCHVFYPAREKCGKLVVARIGIPRRLLLARKRRLSLVEAGDVARLLPKRSPDSHKGDFGRLAILAGSRGKAGAAILAARGALKAGAGLVTVFLPRSLEESVVAALPEAMTHGLPEREGAISSEGAEEAFEALQSFDAAAAGPGLGIAAETVLFLRRILKARIPLVCDADCLNAFAGRSGAFAGREAATVLTPHPGEAARLLRTTSGRVQADRLSAARRLARRSGAVVLLKGAASLTATPDGDVRVNPTGTPLLSTAGAGDVLVGVIGALLAGGLAPDAAAWASAFLHGAAGERLARRLGDAGLLAGEVADELPLARQEVCGPEDRRR